VEKAKQPLLVGASRDQYRRASSRSRNVPTTFVSTNAAGPSIERSDVASGGKIHDRPRTVLVEEPSHEGGIANVALAEHVPGIALA